MKKHFISVALFAVLATMAVSCQKENLLEPQPSVSEIATVRTVLYSVDGVKHAVTLFGDDAWNAFVDNMLALSKQGYEISFVNEDSSIQSSSKKEILTFETDSESKANAWAKEKGDQGYTVTIKCEKGLYTCTAVK